MSIFEGCPITAAGFYCYPLDTLREEKGSQKSFGFRDMKGTWDIVVDKGEDNSDDAAYHLGSIQ